MPILNKETIKDKSLWEGTEIKLPDFDYDELCKRTEQNPTWVHIGPGNIFRGFVAALQHKLIEMKKADTGIIAASTFDNEVLTKIYDPYDNLSLQVIMYANGKLENNIIASVTDNVKIETKEEWEKIRNIFSKPSLQMVSFTITEKGYNIKNIDGKFFDDVVEDFENGYKSPKNGMSIITSLLYTRFKAGKLKIALVSMDNFSHNGDKLFNSVITIAKQWLKNGFVEQEFIDYLEDKAKVTFPLSVIDKITPRPSDEVGKILKQKGFESTELVITKYKTYVAPFVNAEAPQYLVIEDKFPNGRPPLEDAGVYFTDRETVDKVERMKVCTCLNPLHTALAIFGCLLGYNSIAEEMKDESLSKLVHEIGYTEGMPVVTDPKILNPKDFINEVITERLPNAFIPDTPQRIATDTSQKLPIRYGETIKLYIQRQDLDVDSLKYIPLTIAGWCRYLMGIDDKGQSMNLSADPMLPQLQEYIKNIKFGEVESVKDNLKPILSNTQIFGVDLYGAGLGQKIEDYFKKMISGVDAVKTILKQEVQ